VTYLLPGSLRAPYRGSKGLRSNNRGSEGEEGSPAVAASYAASLWLAVLALASIAVVALDALHPLQVGSPTLRATIETCTAVAVVLSAYALHTHFRQTRELRDLLLLGGVVVLGLVDLVSYAGPAILGLESARSVAAAPAIGCVLGAVFLAAASRVPHARVLPAGRGWERIAVAAAAGAAVAAELAGWLLRGLFAPDAARVHSAAVLAVARPASVPVVAAGAALMVLASVSFFRESPADASGVSACFAGAAMLFAAEMLQHLAAPAVVPKLVSTAVGVRLAAFALLALGALRQIAARRLDATLALAVLERKRLARDLHDGLCQDLAFIAAHGEEIAAIHGEEHPLAIAARRALAASRGVLFELSATSAHDTRQALRSIGDELAIRFGINVEVQAEAIELGPGERDELVRIAREAIVNAVRHGAARNVKVLFEADNESVVLRVLDDGCGIAPPRWRREGFGMTSMRERALGLGAQFDARARSEGGTELEVVLP
jgi:signal transduction histidine kinase